MRLLKEIRNYIGNYHVKSGVYHFYRNEFKQAAEFLRKALRDEPRLAPSDREYARCYLTLSHKGMADKHEAKDDLEGAVDELRRATRVNPGYPDIHCQLGGLLDRLNRHDEAVRSYREALVRQPDFVEAAVALGFCLLHAGRHDEAALAFEQALSLRLAQVERPVRRGLEQIRRGDVAEAADSMHQAFRAVPQLSREYLAKALDWMRAEEYEKGLVELDRAIELSPKYPDLHNFRGISLCELGRLDESVEAFRRSAALSPGHLVPRLNLAFAHLRAERVEDAMGEFESILDQDPTDPVAVAKLDELRVGRPVEKRRAAPRGEGR